MSTQQNIKINNVRSIDAKLYNDEYYDFMLYKGEVYGAGDYSEKVIADFSCPFDKEGETLYSTRVWEDAVNDGALLEDIGFTGTDNGFIKYRKDRISNQDFLNILTGSTFEINSGDTRFFMNPVTGNTLNYDYPMSIEKEEDGSCYLSLKGGFYQGFYKLHNFDYQVLPNGPEYEWNLYFKIRPRTDYEVSDRVINHIHPENSGMFFYIGTRAENKFWQLYKTDSAVTESMQRIPDDENYTNAGICGEESNFDLNVNTVIKQDYLADEPEEVPESYFEDDYTISASTPDCPCAAQVLAEEQNKHENYYFDDGYLAEDDSYEIPMGERDCKGHKAPGGDLSSYCEMNSSIYNKKVNGRNVNCSYNSDSIFTISDIYEYKFQEDSSCCGDSPCGCETKKCNKKNNCCCDADYKEPCKCDNFFQDDYYNDECPGGNKAIEDDYMEKDADINEEDIADSFGHELLKKGYFEIESDNKFLMFDRTKDGFTTQNWVEGTTVLLTGRTDWDNINYFPIMNRTKTGYTVNNIYEYQEENSIPYNIYKDIKNNTFGLRVTENGAIGYRYGVLDCESEEQYYSLKEEYSKDGVVKPDEWNDIVVRIVVLNPSRNSKCAKNQKNRKVKLCIYVNGFLVLVSKQLSGFDFRELNDTYQKQEGVPFNISLGGGTQGLLESILPDYYAYNNYILPIEKSFCGSFIGDIKSFKIINGDVNYLTIRNYLSKNK